MTTGFARAVSIAVKTVTEAIAMKHGTVKTVVIVLITRMTNVTIATSVLKNAVTAIINVKTAVRKATLCAWVAGKSVLSVQRMIFVPNAENTVKTAPTIGVIIVK